MVDRGQIRLDLSGVPGRPLSPYVLNIPSLTESQDDGTRRLRTGAHGADTRITILGDGHSRTYLNQTKQGAINRSRVPLRIAYGLRH